MVPHVGRIEPIGPTSPLLRAVSHARIDSEAFSGPGWCIFSYYPRPAGALALPY